MVAYLKVGSQVRTYLDYLRAAREAEKEDSIELNRCSDSKAQIDERHCYHCSSPEHFIHNCPLMKTARDKKQLNRKEGMVMAKGAWTPPKAMNAIKSPQKEAQEA